MILLGAVAYDSTFVLSKTNDHEKANHPFIYRHWQRN